MISIQFNTKNYRGEIVVCYDINFHWIYLP